MRITLFMSILLCLFSACRPSKQTASQNTSSSGESTSASESSESTDEIATDSSATSETDSGASDETDQITTDTTTPTDSETTDAYPLQDIAEVELDFATQPTEDSGITLNNVEWVNGAYVLKRNTEGAYLSEGYIDIAVSEDFSPSGKTLSLAAERINSLVNADFQTEQTVYSYLATSTCGSCNRTDIATGKWFSPATRVNQLATITSSADDSDDYNAKLTRSIRIEQIIPVTPGDDYTVSYAYDASRLADDYYKSSTSTYENQILIVGIKYFDADFNTIEYYAPNEDANRQFNYVSYVYADNGSGNVAFKIRAIDCDEHVKYEAGTGLYESDITFNFCENDGAPLSLYNTSGTKVGTYDSESDIAYMGIYFLASWFGTSAAPTNASDYYALLDDIRVDHDQQIEFQIIGNAGDILQTSTLSDGFYVEENAEIATVRIYLRSEDGTQTPSVSALNASDGPLLEVTPTTKIASYSEPRLGNLYTIGPRTDFMNEDIAMRTLCQDPATEELESCLTAWQEYGLSHLRYPMLQSSLLVTSDAETGEYSFSYTEDGETILKRLLEFSDAGITFRNGIIKVGGFYYDRPDDTTSSAVLSDVDEIVGDCSATDAAKEACYEFMAAYARKMADLFDGETEYTFQYVDAGRTVTLPEFEWEIFNEDNITETDWLGWEAWGSLLDDHETTEAASVAEEMAEFSNRLATVILEENTDANITFTGMAAHYGPVFNTADLAIFIPHLDADLFNGSNFHPYTESDPVEGRENLILERWAAAQTLLDSYSLVSDKDMHITEYGETIEIYDPACTAGSNGNYTADTSSPNLDWSRGYGATEQAHLIARETLTLLSLPAKVVKPYGPITQENESAGRYADADGSDGYECWHSHSIYNFNLVERIAGTGFLSGQDEPSQYRLNDAGLAYATIGKYLSLNGSSPYATTTTTSDDQIDIDNAYYNSFFFENGAGQYVLALWWYDTYNYSYDHAAEWMNYYTGVSDDGFTGRRKHAVKIAASAVPGLSNVTGAKLVALDGSAEENLNIGKDDDGNVYVYGVVMGGLPVMVVLE